MSTAGDAAVGTPSTRVVEIAVAETYDLRRRVLRGDDPAAAATFVEDDREGCFHLGVVDGEGTLIGVASFFPSCSVDHPGMPAHQVRGMAALSQGRGIGSALLGAGIARCRAEGAQVVWANARDTALGFYERHGFDVVGEGFVTADTGLPHHRAVLVLPDLSV